MTILAFFFIAVFGDGAYSWSQVGPFSSRDSCALQSGRYEAAYAFGTHIDSGNERPATSACYAAQPESTAELG